MRIWTASFWMGGSTSNRNDASERLTLSASSTVRTSDPDRPRMRRKERLREKRVQVNKARFER